MTKERFVKYINDIQKYETTLAELDNLGVDLIDCTSISNIEDDLIKMIVEELKLPEISHVGNDLEYWIYELNFGKNHGEDAVEYKDGTPIDLSTVDKLWDYLTSSKQESQSFTMYYQNNGLSQEEYEQTIRKASNWLYDKIFWEPPIFYSKTEPFSYLEHSRLVWETWRQDFEKLQRKFKGIKFTLTIDED